MQVLHVISIRKFLTKLCEFLLLEISASVVDNNANFSRQRGKTFLPVDCRIHNG